MEKNQKTCDQCGKAWQVSINVMPRKTYICPHCSTKKKKAAPTRGDVGTAKQRDMSIL